MCSVLNKLPGYIYTFTDQKVLIHKLLLLLYEISKAFRVPLTPPNKEFLNVEPCQYTATVILFHKYIRIYFLLI